MNPSTSSWLKHAVKLSLTKFETGIGFDDFYSELRTAGFIYGTNQNSVLAVDSVHKLTQQELAKINLLAGLIYVDFKQNQSFEIEEIILRILEFYKFLNFQKQAFKSIFRLKSKPDAKLERLIHERIQTNENLIQKNFSHLITNALLFTDVLAFQHYLKTNTSPLEFAKNLEFQIISLVFSALQQKNNRSTYEYLIIKLLQSSLRYTKPKNLNESDFQTLEFEELNHTPTSKYLIDLTCMAVYSDKLVDPEETEMLQKLGQKLNLSPQEVQLSLTSLFEFINTNKKQIAYFNYSNPLKHFYNRSQRAAKTLLTRNKKRLVQEIMESKELFVLLKQSANRDLLPEEKAKVKSQLLDIFKSIPSLTIFVLPGGSVLLPIIISFIPQLLPSAFNENKAEPRKNSQNKRDKNLN
ncbi:MAG: LETM1-related biofilm-associated protein [Psychroflexus sp.]